MNVKKSSKKWAAVFMLILLITAAIPVQAADTENNGSQIIFLLDGSKSMAGARWQEALDSVLMIDAMLPSAYQTALLVYSEDIGATVAFDQSLEDHIAELKEMKQQGYTNTGIALETALEMFDWNTSGEKRVVIISDGEISMRIQEEAEAAAAAYDSAAASAADRGAFIDLLLYETEDIEDLITGGAELTGGFRFHRTGNNTAENFAESYIFDQLGLQRITLGLSNSSDSLTNITLQDTFAQRARILVTAESQIEDIQVSCQSREIRIVQGERFAVIILEQPLEDNVSLQYTLAEKGRMNAFLVKEYSLAVSSDAAYVPETGGQLIQIRVMNSDGRDILEDQEVRDAVNIYVDGEKAPYEVSRGKAVITWPAEASKEVTLRVDLGGLNSIVHCEDAESSLWLEVPLPEEDNSMQYFWLVAIVAGICVIFVLLCILFFRPRKKKNLLKTSRRSPILMRY